MTKTMTSLEPVTDTDGHICVRYTEDGEWRYSMLNQPGADDWEVFPDVGGMPTIQVTETGLIKDTILIDIRNSFHREVTFYMCRNDRGEEMRRRAPSAEGCRFYLQPGNNTEIDWHLSTDDDDPSLKITYRPPRG